MSKKTVIVSGLVIGLSFGMNAHAAKTVKDILRKIEKKKTNLPSIKNVQPGRSGKINLKIVKPSNKVSAVFPQGSAERIYEEKLNQEIQKLYSLSQRVNSADTRGKVVMKLAKAYSEKATLSERRIQERYESSLKKYLAGSISRRPRLDLDESKKYNKKALALYKLYVRDYPKAEDIDQALFFLGYNSMSLGEDKKAISYYKALSSKYKNSQFIQEANFSLGDYYFEKEDYSKAASYFNQVATNQRSQLSTLARYKMAWVYRKSAKHEKALQDLLAVIRISQNAGLRNKKTARLGEEALRDLPMFYAEAGDARRAVTYFTNITTREKAASSLEQLAYYYMDKGYRTEARYLFDKLVALNPETDKSFDYQYSLVSMQSASGRDDLYEKELYKWIRNYGPNSSWAKDNKDRSKVNDAVKKAELSLRSHILKVHKKAQENRDKKTLVRLEKGYNLYLSSFKGQPNYDEMSFYYAELLYDIGKYEDAYKTYRSVVDNYRSKYKKKAYLNSILSLEKILPKEESIRAKVGKSTKIYPLNPNEEKFVREASGYLSDPSNEENRMEMQYKIASIYYTHNYFDKAELNFKKVIKDYPGTKYAEFSSNLILDMYTLKKDYAGLEKVGKELIAIGGSKNSQKTNAKVLNIVEKSAFKRIEDISKDQDPYQVAKEFLKFGESYPNSPNVLKSYYNAGIYFEKAGRYKEAISPYLKTKILSKNKKSTIYKNTVKFLALIYDRLGLLEKASTEYEYYTILEPKAKEVVPYLKNAVLIREAFNDASGMRRIFKRLEDLDRSKEKLNYSYRLAEAYRRAGDTTKAAYWYNQFILDGKGDKDLLVRSSYKISQIYKKKRQKNEALAWSRKTVELFDKYKNKGGAVAASEAAESKFILTDKAFLRYLDVKIAGSPKAQEQALKLKITKVNALNEELNKVINYDDGYMIVAALSRLGKCYQHLVYAMLNAPNPKGLSKDELAQYRRAVESAVLPFKNNAVTSYKKAIEKGDELRTFNKYYVDAKYELSKLDSEYKTYALTPLYTKPLIINSTKFDAVSDEFKNLSEVKVLNKAAEILSRDKESPQGLLVLAQYYYKKNLGLLSRIYLSKGNAQFKKSAQYYNLNGLISYKQESFKSAVSFFRKAVSADYEYYPAAVNLSSMIVDKGGNAEAVKVLKPVSSKNLGFHKADALNNLGASLRQIKDFSKAKSILLSAEKYNSSGKEVVGNLAVLELYDLKDQKAGKKYLDRYKTFADKASDFDRIKVLEKIGQ